MLFVEQSVVVFRHVISLWRLDLLMLSLDVRFVSPPGEGFQPRQTAAHHKVEYELNDDGMC